MKNGVIIVKKALCILIVIAGLFSSASAEIIGAGYATDIRAYIDGIMVPSYNIDGYTAVLVRDLENYGFVVEWDASTKRVNFYRDFSKPSTPLIPTLETRPVGTKVFDVYATDICTFFRGTEIPSYNIGGKTAVRLRDIAMVGNAAYDEKTKSANVFCREIELFDNEIKYIKEVFFKNMLLLSEADMVFQPALAMIESGQFNETALEDLNLFLSKLNAEIDTFKNYQEPYGFDNSAQELWWAMINMRYAGETLSLMCNNIRNNVDVLSAMNDYKQFRIDSLEQRRVALVVLDEEIQILAFFWE